MNDVAQALTRLAEAIERQAEALDVLAQAIAYDYVDEGAEPMTYLDGTPTQ